MREQLAGLFDSQFMPHGYCYGWRAELVWLHAFSDGLIAASYYAIPFFLVYIAMKRRDIDFRRVVFMFGAFIVLCGTTHVLEIWSIWHGTYVLTGVFKLVTGIVSAVTAMMLVPLVPRALSLPSPAQLQEVNSALEREIEARQKVEAELRALNQTLEQRVEEQVGALRRANEELEREVRERRRAEEGLRDSEAIFRALVEASAQIVWTAEPDGVVREDSPSWRAFTGQTYDEWKGSGWLDALHPDDRETTRAAWQEAVDTEGIFSAEYRLRRADGTWRWTVARGVPLRSPEGRIRCWVGMNTDDTEQKEAQEALLESRRHLSHLLERIRGFFLSVDSELRITYASEQVVRLANLPPEQVIGRSVFDVLPEQRGGRTEAAYRQALASQQPQRYEVQGVRQPDRWYLVELFPSPEGITSFAHDITERREAELARQESETRFRELADAMPQLVWTALPDGTVDYYNRRHQEFAGFREHPDGSWEWKPVVHPDDAERTYESWLRAVATGETYECEHRVRRRDGSYAWYLSRGIPARDEQGNITKWYGTATDIGAQKEAEEVLRTMNEVLEQRVQERTEELDSLNKTLRQRNQELQDFAYVASHDLKEPLRKIVAFAGMTIDEYGEKIDEQGRDYLDRMREASRRMMLLIDDLLALSRVATRGEAFRRLELERVVREALVDLDVPLKETGGVVEIRPLPAIEADPMQMRQLFQNLVANALKFHRENVPPAILIEAEEKEDVVVVTVRDNGIGFEQKYAERIFAAFQRLHGRGRYEGTGMGLAICRRIVERHGGTIEAASEPGVGSVFQVTLPRHPRRIPQPLNVPEVKER